MLGGFLQMIEVLNRTLASGIETKSKTVFECVRSNGWHEVKRSDGPKNRNKCVIMWYRSIR